MVRAGVVNHPSEWKLSGFNEIQRPRRRYSIIDYKSLTDLLNFDNYDELKGSHRKWVEELLAEKEHLRDRKWTEGIAACRANMGRIKIIPPLIIIKTRCSNQDPCHISNRGNANFLLRINDRIVPLTE